MRAVSSTLKFLPIFLLTTPVFADAPCNFKSEDNIIYEGHIESVKLVKREVLPYVEDTRKCTMFIEARIKGEWYPSNASYVFGPDMSQVDACGLAENRAKVKVMREIIPETLKSEKNLKCTLTNVKNSCKVVYMNVVMTDFGLQRVRMESCENE